MIKFEQLECSGFFKEMAGDETEHMKRLNTIHNTLNTEQLATKADSALIEVAREIQEINFKGELESIETLEEAYKLMKRLENSEVNSVYSFLLTEFVPSEKKRDFMEKQLNDHVNKINYFESKYLQG
jgi:hypothetical protein